MFNRAGLIQSLSEVESVTILKPSSDSKDCFSYALGMKFAESALIRTLSNDLVFGAQPIQGEHIWYFSHGEPAHLGFVREDNLVESQWGNGPVVLHPTWTVPLSYGTKVAHAKVPTPEELCALEAKIEGSFLSRNFGFPA